MTARTITKAEFDALVADELAKAKADLADAEEAMAECRDLMGRVPLSEQRAYDAAQQRADRARRDIEDLGGEP